MSKREVNEQISVADANSSHRLILDECSAHGLAP